MSEIHQVDKKNETAKGVAGFSFGILVAFAYIFSIPLALIFGDKTDVFLSFFIPMYGIFPFLGWLLG